MLKFSTGNSKIHKLALELGLSKKQIVCFDLPAGYTCPMANLCQAFANRETGKITDGKEMKFRCYAASSESAFTPVRNLRWHNFDALRNCKNMVTEIENSLPVGVKVIRIHSSGDFFSKDYFNAWLTVAENHPEIIFFGYTKILEYVKIAKPENFKLVYSFGGKQDSMVTDEIVAYVVNTKMDAIKRNLAVSCDENPADDFHYIMKGQSFALVLHGTQPAKKG